MKQVITRSSFAIAVLLAASASIAASSKPVKTTSCAFQNGNTVTGVCEAPRTSFCDAKNQKLICKGAGGSTAPKPVPAEKAKS